MLMVRLFFANLSALSASSCKNYFNELLFFGSFVYDDMSTCYDGPEAALRSSKKFS